MTTPRKATPQEESDLRASWQYPVDARSQEHADLFFNRTGFMLLSRNQLIDQLRRMDAARRDGEDGRQVAREIDDLDFVLKNIAKELGVGLKIEPIAEILSRLKPLRTSRPPRPHATPKHRRQAKDNYSIETNHSEMTCSLSPAKAPWLSLLGSSFKPFSEMLPIPSIRSSRLFAFSHRGRA